MKMRPSERLKVSKISRVLLLIQENVAFLKRLRDANPEKAVLRQVNLSPAVLVEKTLHNLLEDSFIAISVLCSSSFQNCPLLLAPYKDLFSL